MSEMFRAACVQLNAGREIEPNIAAASALIRQAHDAGARSVDVLTLARVVRPLD